MSKNGEVESWLRQLAEERAAISTAEREAEATRKMGFVLCATGSHDLANILGIACPECKAEV